MRQVLPLSGSTCRARTALQSEECLVFCTVCRGVFKAALPSFWEIFWCSCGSVCGRQTSKLFIFKNNYGISLAINTDCVFLFAVHQCESGPYRGSLWHAHHHNFWEQTQRCSNMTALAPPPILTPVTVAAGYTSYSFMQFGCKPFTKS